MAEGWRLVNLTALPTERLRELIEFARGCIEVPRLTIIVTYLDSKDSPRSAMCGYFLPASRGAGPHDSIIKLSLKYSATAAGEELVARIRGRGCHPSHGWPAAFIYTAAHEWMHARQWRRALLRRLEPRGFRRRRKTFPEPPCEAYGLERFRAFAGVAA